MTDYNLYHTSKIQLSLLENELNKLGCEQVQTYFPILSLLKKSDTITTTRLPNLNTVIKIYPNEEEEEENKESIEYSEQYIKTIMSCDVLNTKTNIIKNIPLFIKLIPILEPVQYAMGEFHKEDGSMNDKAIQQINKFNNTAYTEVFANYILSLLVEKEKCPNFPIFYGTYSSILKWFEYDYSQEWNDLEEIDFFKSQHDKGNIEYNFKKHTRIISDNLSLKKEIDLELEVVDLDSDISNSITSEIEDGSNLVNEEVINVSYWCKIKNYPTQVGFFEKIEYTLEEWIEENDNFSIQEWKSILFQLIFALSFIQDRFNMVHNDLHCDNIMFSKTDKEYFYYIIDHTAYRVPTFGRVVKIIDFARATYTIGDVIIFPDVFEENGDAHGQYDIPSNNQWEPKDIQPNPSFDLVRLATTIYEYIDEESDLMELLLEWCNTDDESNVLFEEDSFELYCKIAHSCHNAIPREQIHKDVFIEFTMNVTKETLPFLKSQTLYHLN